MLTEPIKKLRDPLAFALLAATALYLLSTLALLFKDEFFGDLADRAFYLQDDFTHPVWALVLVAAVALVTFSDRPSPQARTVTLVALALLGLMLLLGVFTWLTGYGAEDTGFEIEGKITGTFLALARLLVLAAAAALVYTVLKALPAPARQQQQQWGQQPGQQNPWGQPGQHGQYGQPAQAPWAAAGGAVGGAAGGSGWGQQPASGFSGGGDQPAWGGEQHGAYAASAAPEQVPPAPAGSAAWDQPQQEQGWHQPHQEQQAAWGQPQQEQAWDQPGQEQAWGQPGQEQAWGQPEQEQQAWGQPQQEQQATWDEPAQEQPTQGEIDPHATMVQPAAPDETGAARPDAETDDQQARDDDQRPGWWAPGS